MHSHSHSHPHHHHSHSHDHANATPDLTTDIKHQRKYKPTDFDMDKLRSTLKQFVRDWSEEVNRQFYPFSVYVTCTCITGKRGTGSVLYANERGASCAFLGQTIPGVKVNSDSKFSSRRCRRINSPGKISGCLFLVQALVGWLMMLQI